MIHFQVEMEDLTRIESALGMMKDKSTMVLRTAINNTAKQTIKLLVNEANKEYQFSQPGQVRKSLSIEKATVSNMTATITSKGRVNELYNFMVKPRTYIRGGGVEGGYDAHTKRGTSYENIYLKQNAGKGEDLYRAFVVTYKSGHKTLAQRRPNKKMKSNPTKEFLKTLFAPSIPNILGYEQGVWGIVEPQMNDLLMTNIQAQIQRYLG